MTGITLLDGGMGQELIRRSGREPTALWSARVLAESPALVRDVHAEFIRAGARVITLNSYSVTPERLAAAGMRDTFAHLQAAAIAAARDARDLAGVDGIGIAGCLPPLVTSYRPDLSPSFDEAVATYRHIVEQQVDAVDVFLCETLSSIRDARAAATAATESGKPVWLALTLQEDRSGRLRSGEPLAEALEVLEPFALTARLLNCSSPEAISAAWPTLGERASRCGAYANGFVDCTGLDDNGTVASLASREDLGPERYATHALAWVAGGATIVGGCCEVGPAHIAALADALERDGHELVFEP